MRYHLPSTRMAINYKKIIGVDKNVEKLKTSNIVTGNVKWHSKFGKWFDSF